MNIQTKPFPELNTSRLLLRKLSINDSHELVALRSDDLVNKYIDRDGAITIDEAKAFVAKIDGVLDNKQGVYWAMSLKEDNKLIGTICYWNLIPEKDMAEIGYELYPTYHGLGLMQEAIQVVISYGFNNMGLKVIAALPSFANKSSVALLQRNNFKLDIQNEFVSKEDAGEQAVYILTLAIK